MTNPSRFTQALAYLLTRVASGREYPDAHASAVLRFNVDPDALRDAYDDMCIAQAEDQAHARRELA